MDLWEKGDSRILWELERNWFVDFGTDPVLLSPPQVSGLPRQSLSLSLSLSLSSLDRMIFKCIYQWKDPLLATWGNAAQAWERVVNKRGRLLETVKMGIGT